MKNHEDDDREDDNDGNHAGNNSLLGNRSLHEVSSLLSLMFLEDEDFDKSLINDILFDTRTEHRSDAEQLNVSCPDISDVSIGSIDSIDMNNVSIGSIDSIDMNESYYMYSE